MEITDVEYIIMRIEKFKIDLIVWKCLANCICGVAKIKFKIDLIVWKSTTNKAETNSVLGLKQT